jgi:hypothetical protein
MLRTSKDPLALQDAFHAFNDGSEEYEAYLGRLTAVRKYLNRTFIEIMWTVGSVGHRPTENRKTPLFAIYPPENGIGDPTIQIWTSP